MTTAIISEFSIFQVGDATNTLVELGPYTTKVSFPTDNQPTDVTTMPAGGGQVTDNMVQGPVSVTVTAEGPLTDTVLYYLNQIMAARGGSTWRYATGNNAAPVPGDMMWQATLTLFDVEINYNVGTGAATWKGSWRPGDPGAVAAGSFIVPGYYPY